MKKKRIISVVGARPNFMKIAPIHRAFEQYSDTMEHCIVHTGQHYDAVMSDAFFQDLDMPKPIAFLGVGSASHAVQTAKVMSEFEKVCLELKPDLVLVPGDVNSTVGAALTSVKLGILTAHIESGLRSHDRSMPEEINRIATDAICDYWFVTEQSGVDELLKSGADAQKIFFVGNTMIDSLHYALPKTRNLSAALVQGLSPQSYVLATLHRPSNVDEQVQFSSLMGILAELTQYRDVVFPVHPRTKSNIARFGLGDLVEQHPGLLLVEPQGYTSFLTLMRHADFVMTDSGGIQEETTALGIPCVTLRNSTERPITVELGTNILTPPDLSTVRSTVMELLSGNRKQGQLPPLWDGRASERTVACIAKILC